MGDNLTIKLYLSRISLSPFLKPVYRCGMLVEECEPDSIRAIDYGLSTCTTGLETTNEASRREE